MREKGLRLVLRSTKFCTFQLLAESLPTSPSLPQYLPPKLMGTKGPQVPSYKNQGGAIKNKDQGFEFSMTLMHGQGCHAYLAQFPSMPFGKQEAAIWVQGNTCLTISMTSFFWGSLGSYGLSV